MINVFLSASIPDPLRNPKYIETADMLSIRESIIALASVVIPKGNLIFGGHPAISPLIYMTAKRLKGEKKITIYQSRFFEKTIPKESIAFPRLEWTEAGKSRESSLLLMRKKMITSKKFSCAFFIGGMEGVEEEYKLFKKAHPRAKIFPIATTGAAAKVLFDRGHGVEDQETRELLKNELTYNWLFKRLLTK